MSFPSESKENSSLNEAANETHTQPVPQVDDTEEEMQRKRTADKQIEQQYLKLIRNENTQMLNQECNSEFHNKKTSNATAHPSMTWLGMSRSQDDGTSSNKSTAAALSYRSNNSSPFRIKFRKSHTCGSLFANCNCNSIMTAVESQTEDQYNNTRGRLETQPTCLFSISPPNADISMSTTSGIYSLSSMPPSAQLSRDSEDSRNASFDICAVSSPTKTRQSCCEFSQTTAKHASARQSSAKRSSAVTVTITGTETEDAAQELSSTSYKRQTKRLFQSYSHPDTDFVFTDENRHPSRSLAGETVIKSRSGRVEIKQPKRCSSPNIGQLLDVAVHPDIVVKISPKHSPTQLQTTQSLQQRRKFLQRTHEIDSTSSTSESEHSFDVGNTDSTLTAREQTATTNFDAAQKYFAESGILGPINPACNLIRKTSKILQDSNVIEQIRKTSIILRANSNKKASITTSPISTNLLRVDSQEMEPLEQPVIYKTATPTAQFTNICDFNPTLPTNGICTNGDDREDLIKSLQGEILSLKDVIKSRDNEISKLRREIHKLKSVLQQTTPSLPMVIKTDISKLNNKHEIEKGKLPNNQRAEATFTEPASVTCALSAEYENVNKEDAPEQLAAGEVSAVSGDKHKLLQTVLKKQGVSGESCETAQKQCSNITIPKYKKDYSAKQLIKDAIMDNDFLKNIDASQARELVESFYSLSISKGEFVIREGEVGAHLYVSAEGEFEVVKHGKVLGTMGPGKAFGELAILYNCTRTASIRVLSNARVWVLDRRVFQQIMMRTGMQRRENSVNFLRSVPLLKNLSEDLLAKMADVLEVEFYPAGTYIIRQGANGDTFFLISQGNVKVTQKLSPNSEEKEIRSLSCGDYFGEQALLNEDKRTANIIAMAPGVECLTLDRESFTHLIGDLCELKEKNYGDENRVLAMKASSQITEVFGAKVQQEFPELKLTDLEVVTTLGLGGFGRVELVKAYRNNSVDIFALKCLKKCHIVETKQEEHVFSERIIMLSCNSPFICRLYRTFRDNKYVYMLLEACMGGEIWTMLRDRGCFDDNATQFIIGCVLQAFEYLHARGIIYRDLKPENLMLDERGYVKLVDFGFAKYIGTSSKTWTFCGTPEYVAPEIILNKGHDRAVDYWALGILIHELLNGTPPFSANDPMKTYNNILKGIDMIDFPKHMSRSAVMLIKRLCRDVPAERLGYQKGGVQDIKKHKWFLGFDWDGLESQLLIPPFVRPIAHPTDTSYFDKFPCDPTDTPNEDSGWDAEF